MDTSKKPILITGAGGRLGGYLRAHLAKREGGIRSTDIKQFGPPIENEEIVVADLGDAAAVDRLVEGVSAIVHFGGIRIEESFDKILHANIVGSHNLFDAARRHGVTRFIYASSVHAIGFYETTETIDADVPHRPDTYYGLSKAFVEDMGRLFSDKTGMDVACLRIGTVMETPKVKRHLSTYLSFPDLERLVDACLDAPSFGFSVIYANSKNTRSWWDNSKSKIDYRPQDDSERFAHLFAADDAPTDGAVQYQGGHFIPLEFGEIPADLGDRPDAAKPK
ncbi:MAG: NAD(P)-dependent oxidoreductase [Salinarimonadaceae bacterium]|nr:MAG: NAD(P)-dependent oxidoreductase [Salinarimonadaceae bacterium]